MYSSAPVYCGLLVALLPAPFLSAEVVVFDNSNATFVWVANGDFTVPNAALDPTWGPEEQVFPALNPRAIYFNAFLGGGSNTVRADGLLAGPNTRIARSATPTIVFGPLPNQESTFFQATEFQVGDTIGVNQNYQPGADTGYFAPALGRHNFLGENGIVGFRTILDDGLPRFGWIELVYRFGPSHNGSTTVLMYQPVRWAYETLPNTPITVIPSPGALGVIALAGLVAGRRRRGA